MPSPAPFNSSVAATRQTDRELFGRVTTNNQRNKTKQAWKRAVRSTSPNTASFRQTRPASTMRSRLQQAQQQARMQQSPSSQISPSDVDPNDSENPQQSPLEDGLNEASSLQNQFKSKTQMLRQIHAMQAQTQEEARPTQNTAQEAVGNLIPKVALMIANAIATALELGTAGLAIVLTFFIRFITLGWYNTQMIYGGWIAKGKNKIIGPLTWYPIPLPFPKNTTGNSMSKTMLVIIADIIFLIMLMMPIVFILMIVEMIGGVVSAVKSSLSL